MRCFARPRIVLFWTAAILGACLVAVPRALSAAAPRLENRAFDLSGNVEVEGLSASAAADLQRARACLAEQQWDEGVEILRRLSDQGADVLVPIGPRRFVSLREFCQMQLAALPAEALALYRRRVDDQAGRWYDGGIREGNAALLTRVVDEAFASSWGDKALDLLAQQALERGDTTTARWCWQRILPPLPVSSVELPPAAPASADSGDGLPAWATWPAFPDSKLDLAAIRARLVLCSIIEGALDRAKSEWAELSRLHPTARGRLAGQEVCFADALRQMLDEAAGWPPLPGLADWPAFAGNAQRNGRSETPPDPAGPLWRVPSAPRERPGDAIVRPRANDDRPFFPVVWRRLVFFYDGTRVVALRLDDGRPAWGEGDGTIYRDAWDDAPLDRPLPDELFGAPRFTLAVADGRLYVRLGNPLTGRPMARADHRPSSLVCLDLSSQGRLVWKAATEPDWAFEGSPVVADGRVFVAMRRQGVRVQAHVACFDADNGRMFWRRFVCAAESPGKGALYECSHQLLSFDHGTVYCNTNLGAVAAIEAESGRVRWAALYPRVAGGDALHPTSHWQRDPSPCLVDRSIVFVAPADSPHLFAYDAASGQLLWRSSDQLAEATHLLGTCGPWLLAGGARLYWLAIDGPQGGRPLRRWPEGAGGPGLGRGLLAGRWVLFPTRETIEVFEAASARHVRTIPLAPLGLNGGNLLVAQGSRAAGQTMLPRPAESPLPLVAGTSAEKTNDPALATPGTLLLATADEMVAFSNTAVVRPSSPTPLTAVLPRSSASAAAHRPPNEKESAYVRSWSK